VNAPFPNIRQCLVASLLLHSLFFLIARGLPSFWIKPEIEVEITSPFLGTGPARLAPAKAKIEGAKGIPLPVEADKPVEKAVPVEPPKDWTAKTSTTQKVEKTPENIPTPGCETNGKGTSPLTGGIDGTANYGTPNGTGDGGAPLTAMPKLLNLEELLSLLRKYYPETERRAGNEGDVLLKVHIGADGAVGGSEIVHADSPAFGVAAQKVALLMRFSPAMKASGPVPSAIKVPMQFRLKD